jgi:porin
MNQRLKSLTLLFLSLYPVISFGQSHTTVGEIMDLDLRRLKRLMQLELFFTNDYVSNTGGIQAGPRNINGLDLYLNSDLSKYSRINGELNFHFVHINADDRRGQIGDSQIASSVDMPGKTDRLTDAWYQQVWSERFKTLIGIHDISSEFNITSSSLNFLNQSFGTTTDFAVSGTNGPSIYPITSLGLRAEIKLLNDFVLRSGIYDADPGDTSTYRQLYSKIGLNEGYLVMTELAQEADNQKWGLGNWTYSNPMEKINNEEESAAAFGFYLMQEKKWGHSLWTFARYGWANPLVNSVQSNFVTGMAYKGIFQTKKHLDEVGLGYSTAHFSRNHRKAQAVENDTLTTNAEDVFEFYYQFQAAKFLSFRPDIQYIQTPSGLSNIPDAWAFGLRTVVQL